MSEPANKADIQRVTDAVESLASTIQAATEQQTAVLRDFVDLIERHREPAPSGSQSGGSATITINAGGWATMLAAAFAAVCFYVASDARSDAAELRAEARDIVRRVERREDYLNMLWQRYPELRPEELEKK
jgi:hypothetical protein